MVLLQNGSYTLKNGSHILTKWQLRTYKMIDTYLQTVSYTQNGRYILTKWQLHT